MIYGTNNLGYGVIQNGVFGAANPAVATLQRTVALLAMNTGDKALAVKIDGVTGPATARAVNRAMTVYAKTAPAQLRSGKLTPAQVAQSASQLTSWIAAAAKANPPRGARPVASKPAVTKASVKKPVPAAPAKPTRSPTVERLQRALAAMAKATGDKLLAIKADGIPGPKTAAAVNRAMVKYVTQAPAQYRSGRMTVTEVTMNAEGLARAVEAATAVRGVKPPARPKDAPPGKLKRSPAVTQIQQLVGQLADLIPDPALAVVVDGISGPKTAAAVNRALKTKYSVAQISTQSGAIIKRLSAAVAARGQRPAEPAPAPMPDAPTAADMPEAVPPEAAAAYAQSPQVQAQAAQAVEAAQTAQEAPPEQAAAQAATQAAQQAASAAAAYAPSAPSSASAYEQPAVPEYIPPAPPPSSAAAQAYAPEGSGSESAMVPSDPASAAMQPAAEPKKFPTMWVVGGVLGLAGIGGALYLMSRKGETAPTVRERPARSRSSKSRALAVR